MTSSTPHHRSLFSQENILVFVMGFAAFAFIAFHVSPLWKFAYHLWFTGLMFTLAVLALINAVLTTGYRNAIVFLVLAAVIGFSAEQFGIVSGLIFGPYVYTDRLQPKLLDVPIVIPLCWFAIVYFAHVLTNLIISGVANLKEHRLWRLSILAMLTAFIATGFDLAIDPLMSHKEVQAWIWTDGGAYFGVPFKNFQGWVLTAFAIDSLYRLFVREKGVKPVARDPQWAAMWVIAAWAALAVGFILIGNPIETQMIAVFAVLLPAALAAVSTRFGAPRY